MALHKLLQMERERGTDENDWREVRERGRITDQHCSSQSSRTDVRQRRALNLGAMIYLLKVQAQFYPIHMIYLSQLMESCHGKVCSQGQKCPSLIPAAVSGVTAALLDEANV